MSRCSRRVLLADHPLGTGAELRDHRVHQRRGVGGEQAEGIADLVLDRRAVEADLDVPRLLLAARIVEAAAGQEQRLDRVLAAIAKRSEIRRRLRGVAAPPSGRGRAAGGAELLLQLLEHAQGLLAAGLAKIQALLVLQEDRVGVVGAVVAALAAILLGHGGHQLLRLGAVLGHRHPIADRHGRVVPGRVVVVGELRAGRRRLARRERGGARDGGAEEGREIAREPGALVLVERRGLGDQDEGGRDVLGHAAAFRAGCSSAASRSASAPVRAVKAWKLSRGPARRREVGAQQRLDAGRRILGLHGLPDLRADLRVLGEAAADHDVVALDGVALLRDDDLGADQPDIADVVLGAAVVAAGEVDVHRHVELRHAAPRRGRR